jgi:hypothetical protein
MAQAGSYAADWTVDGLSGRTRAPRFMPAWMRRRRVVRLACRLVREGWVKSRATVRRGRGSTHLIVTRSAFCDVREPAASPLCGFYAAAVGRLFERFDLPATVTIESCRGAGGSECAFGITAGVQDRPAATGDLSLLQ